MSINRKNLGATASSGGELKLYLGYTGSTISYFSSKFGIDLTGKTAQGPVLDKEGTQFCVQF